MVASRVNNGDTRRDAGQAGFAAASVGRRGNIENRIGNRWSAPRQVPAQSIDQAQVECLEDVRENIEQQVQDHLRTDQPSLLIIPAPPGVGKTRRGHRAAVGVAQATGTSIGWFGTRHDQFDAVDRSPGWIHTEGRHGDELDPHGNIIRLANCERANAAHTIGSKGWSVSEIVCGVGTGPRCPQRFQCPWWLQWHGDGHRYMPSQHLALASLWDRPGLRIVFDELDAQHFASEPISFDLNTLGTWIRTWPDLVPVLVPLLAFLAQNEGYLADAPLYEVLAPILPSHPISLLREPLPATNAFPNLEAYAEALPDGRVSDLLRELYQELERHRRGDRFVSRIAIFENRIILSPRLRLPEQIFTRPAVLLNATADVEALRHLLELDGYPIQVLDLSVALHPETETEYRIDANHSKAALKDPAYRKRWVRRVREAVASCKKALVVATIYGEAILSKELADLVNSGTVVLAHYGALSGLNDYEGFDTIVLAQPFNPAPAAVAGRYRRIYGGTPGEPLDLSIGYRRVTLPWEDDDGLTWEVSVTSMRDERLAPIYERWRWSEMYQAAHRVRPLLFKRRIVVLCAIPLPGLEPTSVTYTARKGRTLAKLRAGARQLISEQGYFTRQDLAQATSLSKATVRRYWEAALEAEGLETDEIAVPSDRYYRGRGCEAAFLP